MGCAAVPFQSVQWHAVYMVTGSPPSPVEEGSVFHTMLSEAVHVLSLSCIGNPAMAEMQMFK